MMKRFSNVYLCLYAMDVCRQAGKRPNTSNPKHGVRLGVAANCNQPSVLMLHVGLKKHGWKLVPVYCSRLFDSERRELGQ